MSVTEQLHQGRAVLRRISTTYQEVQLLVFFLSTTRFFFYLKLSE